MKPKIEWAEVNMDIPQYLEDAIAGFIFDLGSHGVFTDRAKSKPYFDLFSSPRPERLVLAVFGLRAGSDNPVWGVAHTGDYNL